MICPFMSRPIVYSTVESGGDQETSMYWVPCQQERCPMWNDDIHRCEKR